MALTEEQLLQARIRADESTFELDVADSQERLVDFVSMMWSAAEPTRPFIRGWAIDGVIEHLEAVHRGEIQYLVMNVPPGFMKSLSTCVFFPAWEWGPMNRPGLRYVCASYSHDLTIRDNVRCRRVIQDKRYQRAWGDRYQILEEQNAKVKFENDKLGWKIATSVHGLGTGERGDRIVVDDPHNVLDAESDAKRNDALQWFTEVMPTRVNNPKTCAFIVIMQRVHEMDTTGLIFEKDLGYTRYVVPMHYDPDHPHATRSHQWKGWAGDPREQMAPDQPGVYHTSLVGGSSGLLAFPEYYDAEDVESLTKKMMAWGGMYSVAGQLEQRPEPRGGGMVKEDWFEIVEELPEGYRTKCRGWDFASTEGGEGAGSSSVKTEEAFTPDGNSDLFVTDVWWDRVSPGDLYTMIQTTVALDGYDVFQSLPQDPGQAGKYQVDDLLELFAGYDFEFSLESGDKVARFRPWAAQAETRFKLGRKIKLLKAPWNRIYLDHVTKFPMGRFKDIPDGQSRSYGGLVKRGGGQFLVGGSTLVHIPRASN